MKAIVSLLFLVCCAMSLPAAAFADGQFSEGKRIEARWEGSWYRATILKMNGDHAFVHYDGFSPDWDEWVAPARLRAVVPPAATSDVVSGLRVGDSVVAYSRGGWRPARIVSVGRGGWRVSFGGADGGRDEWIPPGWLRK